MILWNLFWGNSVCQHSSVKIIVLRRQANHNAVPTNTNRKTNQTSVFQRPANSLLTEYLVQHRIRHHIDKQLRLQKWHIMSQNSMISEQIVCVANTPCHTPKRKVVGSNPIWGAKEPQLPVLRAAALCYAEGENGRSFWGRPFLHILFFIFLSAVFAAASGPEGLPGRHCSGPRFLSPQSRPAPPGSGAAAAGLQRTPFRHR